jgi:N-acetylglucosamine-6-phosphate deacetylase
VRFFDKQNPGHISEVTGIHYESKKPVKIEIVNGLIDRISETDDIPEGDTEYYVAPGLIDNQVNGYSGVDFSGEGLTVEKIRYATGEIWKDGVTSFVPTIVTGSHENILRNLKILSGTISEEFFKGSIPGFHLEGPYLSDEPGFYGCHPLKYLRNPSWEEFSEYQEAAGGGIIEITLAPELDRAIEFIAKCNESGIIVGLGHTNSNSELIFKASEYGAVLSTHLGNGCANLINRHINPLWPQLACEKLLASVIADGHHLLPEELKVFYKVKGDKGLILISDVTHFIGMKPGEFEYMGNMVRISSDGLAIIPELNCLAGATMPLKKGIETIKRDTGCTLDQAINLATRNVAGVLKLNDRGVLQPGKRADIVAFKSMGNELIIKKTFVKGQLVFSS